jgi:O-antigen/teichoic acid export membrane protein
MGVYSLIAHIHMRTDWLIIPNLIGGVLSIALISLLIPIMGAAGAGFGLVISGAIVVAIMHFYIGTPIAKGMVIRPILIAGICSITLWAIYLSLHYYLDTRSWLAFGFICSVIGGLYLGMQYLFLRPHLRSGVTL